MVDLRKIGLDRCRDATRAWLYRELELQSPFRVVENGNNTIEPGLRMRQWTPHTFNFMARGTACPNNCRYCYVRSMSARFGRPGNIEDQFRTDEEKAGKVEKWRKVTPGKEKVYMFPSTHDIFDECVERYADVTRNILSKGHGILCVSKPKLSVVRKLCEMLGTVEGIHERFMFRFTIGSDDPDTLAYWEPSAPGFEERLESLRYAHSLGFQTSISMEPMLTDPCSVVELVKPFVTDSIWIGLMNHRGTLAIEDEEDEKRLADVLKLHQPSKLCQIIHALSREEKVYWKESVMAIFKLRVPSSNGKPIILS